VAGVYNNPGETIALWRAAQERIFSSPPTKVILT
jgi:hypothetical protein